MRHIKHAAIRKDSIVYVGYRHHNCIAVMVECGITSRDSIQGFVDNDGVFLDRYEALLVAMDAKQIIKKHSPKDRLTSEDLY